ncbi:MAG: hypothetical protein K2W92_01185 [Alphaproteobacteria bacterium]|nr:hypothetical protein [Alphaproteobacteria bacterium]
MFPNIPSILATLDISGKALSLQELEHAVDLTRNNISIVHVAVNSIHQRNPWTEDGRAHCLLAALTLRNSLLKGLVTELSYHFFSESNLEEDAISEGLKNSTSIKRVDFLLNGGKRKSLIGSLKESKELESIAITLYGCNLIPTEVNDLTYLIASPLSLKSLKLEVLFDDFLILSLATALKEKAISLEQLTLISAKETEKEEKIKTETMKSLFKAISTNKSLQVLRLRLPLSLQSFQDFAECLKANTTLKVLALPENYISDQNVSSLAEGVKENNSLTTIDLSFNSISDSGADSLLNMLNVNSTLESLYLFHNKIGYSKKMAIAQALHQRRPIAFIEGKTSE